MPYRILIALGLIGQIGCDNGHYIETGSYQIIDQTQHYVDASISDGVDQELQADACAPVFQFINLSDRLRIDMEYLTVTELDTTNDERFELSSSTCEVHDNPMQNVLGPGADNPVYCERNSDISFVLESGDEELDIEARMQAWLILEMNEDTGEFSGLLEYELNDFRLDGGAALEGGYFNPDCVVNIDFLLEGE